jgi:hypothetical protein
MSNSPIDGFAQEGTTLASGKGWLPTIYYQAFRNQPMKTCKAFTALLLFAAMRSGIFADTVSLPAQKDNTIYLDLNGQLSNGQGIYLFAGRTTNDLLRRGLIAFDLTSIPTSATITQATLSMFSNRPRPNDAAVDVSLNRALLAWGEGASDAGEPGGIGAQAETNDATWLHTFFNTSFWTTPGGDFAVTPSATTPVLKNGTYSWSSSGLVADVQSWVSNPATNFGWFILVNEVDSGTAQRFNTRQNTNDTPHLTVTYQVPTATPTPTPSPTPHTPTPTPSPTPTPTPSPTPTPTPTASPTPMATPTPTPTPTPGTLGNISTRLRVLSGDNVLIGGMIATGTGGKRVIIRAIGPSLTPFGVPGALANPTLDLFQGNTPLFSNDDWQNSAQQAEIANSGLAPSDAAESAIIWTLTPGQNYTAAVQGKNGTTGIGVVEVFDLDRAAASKLGDISTRGFVDVDDNVMIAGLIAGPGNGTSLKILVRALGPTLSDFGVASALVNPTLDLVNSSGTVIRSNDNWKDDPQQRATIEAAGLAPTHDEEAALVETVAPGAYTAIVRGSGRATGVGLVEVYNIP